MGRRNALVEKIAGISTEPPRSIVIYDEHVCDVLYATDDAEVPVVGDSETDSARDLVKRHLTEEPFLEEGEALISSYTYHTERFVVVQIPLEVYRGVLVSFAPSVELPLQRLHERIREWDRERQTTPKDARDSRLSLLSLLPVGSRISPEAPLISCHGFCSCVLACGCCVPI